MTCPTMIAVLVNGLVPMPGADLPVIENVLDRVRPASVVAALVIPVDVRRPPRLRVKSARGAVVDETRAWLTVEVQPAGENISLSSSYTRRSLPETSQTPSQEEPPPASSLPRERSKISSPH